MKDIMFYIGLLALASLWIGHTRITSSFPYLQIKYPLMAVGLLLFTVGISLMFISKYGQGRKQGHKDAIEYLERKNEPGDDPAEKA